jgi:hypothetical protein
MTWLWYVVLVLALGAAALGWYAEHSARRQPLQPFKVENTWERLDT